MFEARVMINDHAQIINRGKSMVDQWKEQIIPVAWRWESAYGGEQLLGNWQVSTVKPDRPSDATDFVCEPLYPATSLAITYKVGQIREREACATFAKNWLEDWGHDLLSISDQYRDAVNTGKMDGRNISPEYAKTFAKEFRERSDAIYDCADPLAKDVRNRKDLRRKTNV